MQLELGFKRRLIEVIVKKIKTVDSQLDYIDARILNILAENSRTPTAEIARRLKMSSPSATERIIKLEEAGVINSYTISVDPKSLGFKFSVWIRINPLPGMLRKVVEVLEQTSNITECDRITGDDCFLAKALLKEMTDLEYLIDCLLPIAKTHTSVVQASPFKDRLPPLCG